MENKDWVVPRPYLANPKLTRDVLERHDFTIAKKFGQNFLVDSSVSEGIIEAAKICPDDLVIEIGPGIGTLTQYLAVAAGRVVAVEIDRMLMPVLDETLQGYRNVEVINDDILKVDIPRIVAEKNQGRPVKIVANLPYYITTPIIMTLLERRVPSTSITIMVQKEVAERMQAGPGSKDYGALSLAVQYYADPQVVMTVPPSAFMPRPKVDSAVVKLDAIGEPKASVADESLFFKIVRACFNQRRKTLANGLKNSAELDFPKDDIEAAILAMGKPLTVRGETLTLNEFAELANALAKVKNGGAA